jgi:5-(carboxyamino)imidazole ribonucleotide synthase
MMQKLRRGGYDGRGVFRINSPDDLKDAFTAPSLVEELIPFKKEIAVIVARNSAGECKCFPVVEMQFNSEANLVEFLFSPADIDSRIQAEAQEIATRVAGSLKITGVLAVEMFLTDDHKILVNEIAPRPHNSGHHTIEANITSQYEQHLRAILGMPLGSTAVKSFAVMVNLLGEKNYEGPAVYEGIEKVLKMDGVYIHLYGKKFSRPFRKMGHVTITGDNRDDTIAKAHTVKKILRVISE